jgi:ATP-dependent RNA helicase HelY
MKYYRFQMPQRRKDNRRDRRKPSDGARRRHSSERNIERNFAEQSSAHRESNQTLSQLKSVEQLLSGIGVPAAQPFKPDDFQIEALNAIETDDVLVTAPTGSGKTWIAREEIRRLLEQGKRAWYTTPLKALTNSKYAEFSTAFGPENVGVLTGDRKENSDAPLIVGTTEIFRNQLFDALRQGEQVRTDLVILDEAHYLSDDERGHVWEEAIILTPPRIRMLLLSATVGRAEEFAGWIESVRGTRVHVINRAGTRPVELRAAYLSSGLQLFPLLDETGKFNSELDRFAVKRESGFRRRR